MAVKGDLGQDFTDLKVPSERSNDEKGNLFSQCPRPGWLPIGHFASINIILALGDYGCYPPLRQNYEKRFSLMRDPVTLWH